MLILFFGFVQASAVKPGVLNLFLSYCFLNDQHQKKVKPRFSKYVNRRNIWVARKWIEMMKNIKIMNNGYELLNPDHSETKRNTDQQTCQWGLDFDQSSKDLETRFLYLIRLNQQGGWVVEHIKKKGNCLRLRDL